ncbi:MAG TPA: aminoacetone oxidase family FAD-binding enzyme [Candidatus Udaeobacter sp.]|nr:aminoacetone oxidase family FAD-binding enzyme [Candidatus Udaeobacter sp.]
MVVGAGAAGLMAAISAARATPGRKILVLESAPKPGKKILISGGGRCNVTNSVVTERDFAGSTPAAIRKILTRFDAEAAVRFFAELGVRLKTEPGGKLFPETDRARTVLDAMLAALSTAGATLRANARVETIERASAGGFVLRGTSGELAAKSVILATGGKSLPETGSDGHGYELARGLGHTTTAAIHPALVPLLLPRAHPLTTLSGVATPVELELRSGSGKRLLRVTGPLLCTHFGVSGPAVLDLSRHLVAARGADPEAQVVASFWPGKTAIELDRELQGLGHSSPLAHLRLAMPERLARLLCEIAGVDPASPGHRLTRGERTALVQAAVAQPLPVTGDRGFRYAEVTAGGVPLAELKLDALASRVCPGLHLCGEILDVDGRLGGFNFQWAWASGVVAGRAAARSVDQSPAV